MQYPTPSFDLPHHCRNVTVIAPSAGRACDGRRPCPCPCRRRAASSGRARRRMALPPALLQPAQPSLLQRACRRPSPVPLQAISCVISTLQQLLLLLFNWSGSLHLMAGPMGVKKDWCRWRIARLLSLNRLRARCRIAGPSQSTLAQQMPLPLGMIRCSTDEVIRRRYGLECDQTYPQAS